MSIRVLKNMFTKRIFYVMVVIVGSISAQSLPKTSINNTSSTIGWISAYTNIKGNFPRWEITNTQSSDISQYIFHLLKTDAHGSEFNLCYTKKIKFLNGAISVKFKANSGREDQGGGIVWRIKDNNNYYVARYNPLEDNLCFYYVKNSYRRLLNSATVVLDKEHWHTMKIIQHNDHYQVFLDSKNILQGYDSTFTNAGGIGVWTKSDALTSFKALKITKED